MDTPIDVTVTTSGGNNSRAIPEDLKTSEMVNLTKEKSKALNKVTRCNTMMGKDSFLGSLLVLPVELWKGIAG